MNNQARAALRSKKLGVLIRDARIKHRKTLSETAGMVGTTAGIIRAWEEGRRSPSLPELELLAYGFSLPLGYFWGGELQSDASSLSGNINQKALIAIRQRFIGALLRQSREKKGRSIAQVAEHSGISQTRLRAFEMGERPIPLPELEGIVNLLGESMTDLFDQTSPVGEWMVNQQAIAEFQQLPGELRDFISKPGNRPYLELALKLSALSSDKLRSVAESLLDITF